MRGLQILLLATMLPGCFPALIFSRLYAATVSTISAVQEIERNPPIFDGKHRTKREQARELRQRERAP